MIGKKIRPYLFVLAVLVVYAVLAVTNQPIFSTAAFTAIAGTWEMLAVIPPIFVLLGL
ncbi:MAG: permease, partial [Spirochaetaceae bacterium]